LSSGTLNFTPLYHLPFEMPDSVSLKVTAKVTILNKTGSTIYLNGSSSPIHDKEVTSFGEKDETTYLSTIQYDGKIFKCYKKNADPDDKSMIISPSTVFPGKLFVEWDDSVITGFVTFEPEKKD
ncbi:hypothetical protein H0H93_016138, partial [Arthromyces matolae]